jgi:hypothetical protein
MHPHAMRSACVLRWKGAASWLLVITLLCLGQLCLGAPAPSSPAAMDVAPRLHPRALLSLRGPLDPQRSVSSFHVLQVVTPCQAAMNTDQYYQWLESAGELEAALQAGNTAAIRVQCSQVAPALYADLQSLLTGVCSNPSATDQSVIQTVQTIVNAENEVCAQQGQAFAGGSGGGGGALSADGAFVSWDASGCSSFDDCYQKQVWVTLAVLEVILGLTVFGLLVWLSHRRAATTSKDPTSAEYRRVHNELASIQPHRWRSLDVNGRCIVASIGVMLLFSPPLLIAGVAQPYCVGWLLAFWATMTPLRWLHGAALALQMRTLHLDVVRALQAALYVVGVAGVLSCIIGVYATLVEAACISASTPPAGLDQICSGDGATRSVHAVYDVQFLCFKEGDGGRTKGG